MSPLQIFTDLEPGSQIKVQYRHHEIHFVKLNDPNQCAVIIKRLGQFERQLRTFGGFEICAEPENWRYVIRMPHAAGNLTIFSSLIEFMLLRLSVRAAVDFNIIENLANEWVEFSKNIKNELDKKFQLGLLGELLFLENLISELSANMAITSWVGPSKNKVDFIFSGDLCVEVKASANPLSNDIQISSLEQLAAGFNSHFLRRYGIAITPNGRTLLDLYHGIMNSINDYPIKDEFRAKIMQYGFNPFQDYEGLQKFSLVSISDYDVNLPGFPKIIGPLNESIIKLKYTINVSAIKKLSDEIVFEKIKLEPR